MPAPSADHGHAQRRALALADRRDRLTDAAVLVIVGDRLGPPGDRRAVVVRVFSRAPWIVVPCISTWYWPCGVTTILWTPKKLRTVSSAALVGRIDADQDQRERDGGKDLPAVGVEPERQQQPRARRSLPAIQTRWSSSQIAILPSTRSARSARPRARRETASTSGSSAAGARSPLGRHSAASASRIGYSATQEKATARSAPRTGRRACRRTTARHKSR